MTESEWMTIQAGTVKAMIEHVAKFSTPISKVIDAKYGQHCGTGSFVETNGSIFLVTNEHVVKEMEKQPLAYQTNVEGAYLKLNKPVIVEPEPVEFASSEIPSLLWKNEEREKEAIKIERFAKSHSPVDGELLFLAGYSGERSKFVFGELHSKGTPYLTQEKPFPANEPRGVFEYHFALHYQPDLATSIDGTSSLPDAHGFSGSLVWNTRRIECLQNDKPWTPESAQVTGILWAWPSQSSCLLATRVEKLPLHILAAISTVA